MDEAILKQRMNYQYLELIKRTLNNSIYLGTDSSACNKEFYENHEWKVPRSCIPHTLCNKEQLDFLGDIMSLLVDSEVNGDFLEVGVWRGGVSIFIKAFLKVCDIDSKVYLADTFSGIPYSSSKYPYPNDVVDSWEDRWEASLDEVKEHFRRYNLLDSSVCFLEGEISSSLISPPFQSLALARLDVDSYESYMNALINVYPRMADGGCIIFDDWHLTSCRDAVNDFIKNHNITVNIKEEMRGKKVAAHFFVKR